MIVVFEGAPASGKTTLAKRLEDKGSTRIPEVNELFERPTVEVRDWYLQSQISRWELAHCDSGLSILDGDIFQPIWFSWMYPNRVIQDWQYALNFYIQNHARLGVPDRFFLLRVPEDERKRRERERCKRRGLDDSQTANKVEKYADFARLQHLYFDKLSSYFPGWILSLNLGASVKDVQAEVENYCEKPELCDLLEVIRLSLNELSISRTK